MRPTAAVRDEKPHRQAMPAKRRPAPIKHAYVPAQNAGTQIFSGGKAICFQRLERTNFFYIRVLKFSFA